MLLVSTGYRPSSPFSMLAKPGRATSAPELPVASSPTWCRLTAAPRMRSRTAAAAMAAQDVGRHDPRAKSWMDRVKEFFQG